MKYKAGDKVRVRKDLEVGKDYGRRAVVPEMTNLAGMIATIKSVSRDYYELEEDIDLFDWTDEMIEGLWEECKPKLKLIDILNKIANGELKEGTKVIYNNSTFEYRKLHKDSGRNTLDLYSKNNTSLINATYLTPVLSFEVELIEPQEPDDNIKIEELVEDNYQGEPIQKIIADMFDKLNEVIRYINKEDNNE